MMEFEVANDVKERAIKIAKKLKMDWIDFDRVIFIRSKGSKSKAYARCYGLPRIWQFALDLKPHYIIEVLSENFDKLNEKDKEMVIIHELLHIPKKFSGGLVSHRYVTRRKVFEFLKKLNSNK